MKIEVVIPPAARKYAADCAAIHAAAFEASGNRSWSNEEFSNLLDRETILLLITKNSFLLVEIIHDEAEILTFAVHPDKMKQGLGRSLLESFFEECTFRKVNNCILEVAEDNATAIKLYQSCNFKTISIRARYFKRKDDFFSAFVMKKDFHFC